MGKKTTRDLSPQQFYAKLKRQREQPRATIITAALLAVFMVLLFFVMPPQLPWILQKMFAVVNAVLALLVVVFGVRELGKKHSTVDLPFWRKIDLGWLGGGVLSALVMGWWLSPFSPIKVGMPGADEVARLLSDELTLAVLVMPDTTLAVIEPPLPPPAAATIAMRISRDADAYSLLVKAIAERRYIEAAALATKAEAAGVDAMKLAVARGQLDVFAGQYAAALPRFDQAVGAGNDASVMGQQSVAQALAGNSGQAYETATRLLEGARSGRIKGLNALGMSLNLKAALAASSGRFTEALKLIEESQLAWESAGSSPHRAASLNNQAVVYAMLPKKYAGAETQFNSALALWRDLYGSKSGHVAGSSTNLGVLAISQAAFAEAQDRLTKALELARKNFPPESAGLFAPLNALARLNTLIGRYPEAAKFSEAAQRSTRHSLQLEMAQDAARGALLTGQGAYPDAAGSYGRALMIGKQIAVSDHAYLADVRSRKAALSSLQGRRVATIASCEEAIKVFEQQLGANHPLIARTCNTLGWEYLRTGQKPLARKQFERAQEIFAANQNEISLSPDLGRTRAGQAQLYARREWNEAINKLREAVKVEVDVFGPVLGSPANASYVETPSTAEYLFDQAVLYTVAGSSTNFEKALNLFERAIAMRENLLPKTHPVMAETYESFAKLLRKMEKTEAAAAMEKKAQQARELGAKSQ